MMASSCVQDEASPPELVKNQMTMNYRRRTNASGFKGTLIYHQKVTDQASQSGPFRRLVNAKGRQEIAYSGTVLSGRTKCCNAVPSIQLCCYLLAQLDQFDAAVAYEESSVTRAPAKQLSRKDNRFILVHVVITCRN